ncbi:tetratricopeptide repeat protein [Streptomyces sp. Z26]|uniref:tetratricopeptide repeat protein n=1 Tax=Streptomyces sp. Z26 TaxID=2500177 RepID=UPI000EF16AC9|nr:tetratricopeptide repeat protein [Streptomyces sp. Z26]RLL67031.1 tetratricopeptide repeat protein [Streptomyces sp. Z26]
MASSPSTSPGGPHRPNTAFRRLRGSLSPGEFAAAVRRSARDIGERVSCDARYVGRVESGEIRCPNYAYERVFRHMFPGLTLADMGFAPRESVRGRTARAHRAEGGESAPPAVPVRGTEPGGAPGRQLPEDLGSNTRGLVPHGHRQQHPYRPQHPYHPQHVNHPQQHPPHPHHPHHPPQPESDEESDVLRRAFMTGGPAALAAVPLHGEAAAAPRAAHSPRPGAAEAEAVERAVRQIRLLDDRYGADGLYERAGDTLRAAYELLDAGAHRREVSDRLHAGAGELAISVGWLAHDSGRFEDARSHYAEALATARVAADPALEAHAFCNTAFLARDAGRPREAIRAAQAGQQAAAPLGSARLESLLALREAGGWAGMGDRAGCAEALGRAHTLFARGASDADPAWMSFFGEAELEGLEAQCWAALGDWEPATAHARRAVDLQEPHFVRNRALFTAELAGDLAARREPEEAAAAATEALALLGPVRSGRIRAMLTTTARTLDPYRRTPAVAAFLDRQARTA